MANAFDGISPHDNVQPHNWLAYWFMAKKCRVSETRNLEAVRKFLRLSLEIRLDFCEIRRYKCNTTYKNIQKYRKHRSMQYPLGYLDDETSSISFVAKIGICVNIGSQQTARKKPRDLVGWYTFNNNVFFWYPWFVVRFETFFYSSSNLNYEYCICTAEYCN